jgi:hypothetical protein
MTVAKERLAHRIDASLRVLSIEFFSRFRATATGNEFTGPVSGCESDADKKRQRQSELKHGKAPSPAPGKD